MARKKQQNIYPVKSLEEANQTLEKIAALQRSINVKELSMNEQIDLIKAKTEIETVKDYTELQALVYGLEVFSKENKARLFDKKRSIDLNFGSIGFRKGTKLATMAKTTWKKVVELLEEKGMVSGVRIKKTANKDVMNEWTDEKLEKVNVQRKTTDTFWYEINEEDVQVANG